MQIHVQTPGAGSYWITGELIVEDHQGCGIPNKYVTFKVRGGLPAHILIFAVSDRTDDEDGTTGITGSTGGSGY